MKRHQNSHLFWWRPSPSPPAEKLLAVQREQRQGVSEWWGREKQHGDGVGEAVRIMVKDAGFHPYSCGNVTLFIETLTYILLKLKNDNKKK